MTNAQLLDAERGFYLRQLSLTSGNREDLRRLFYKTQLGANARSDNAEDLELQWLSSKAGVTAADRLTAWKEYLTSLGYTGHVDTMRLKYYSDND